jgi:hypothetical protein
MGHVRPRRPEKEDVPLMLAAVNPLTVRGGSPQVKPAYLEPLIIHTDRTKPGEARR